MVVCCAIYGKNAPYCIEKPIYGLCLCKKKVKEGMFMRESELAYKEPQNDEFLTFAQTAQRFPAFTEGSLRWMRFNDTNGFNRCVRKIGKKCVISVLCFKHWVESNVP